MADRADLEQRLAKMTEQIANGERHIVQQRDIIAELERGDRPADYARYLLAGLEILQAALGDTSHRKKSPSSLMPAWGSELLPQLRL
jgi:hypothetical protein